MKYSVRRDDVTICIGHCTDVDSDGYADQHAIVREIEKRVHSRNSEGHDNGVTYRAEWFYDGVLKPGDIITLFESSATIELKRFGSGRYAMIGKSDPAYSD